MLAQRTNTAQDELQPSGASSMSAESERPTMRSVAPEWAAMTDRYAELTRREVEIETELKPLVEYLRDKTTAFLSLNNIPSPPQPPDSGPDPKVVSLLGELMPPHEKRERGVKYHWSADKARAAELAAELDALRLAKQFLEERIRKAHFEGSRALCRALAPEYQIVADRMINAIVELGCAHIAQERWLRANLRDQGASHTTLRPVTIQAADEFGDPISRLLRLRQFASECGWCDPMTIPQEFKGRN